MFNRIALLILFAALPATLVFAQAGSEKAAPVMKAPAAGEIQEQLIKMENDWAAAAVKRDIAVPDATLAEDWIGLGLGQDTTSKAQFLADLKSGTMKVDFIKLTNMKVRIYVNTAVVTGADDEKSSYKGTDTSGHYVWMDVFVKRDGKWKVETSEFTQMSGPK